MNNILANTIVRIALLVFLTVFYIINGTLAVTGLVISGMVLVCTWGKCHFGWIVGIISLIFTLSPLAVDLFHSEFIEKNQLYAEVLEKFPTTDARECRTLPAEKTSEFYDKLNDVVLSCGKQSNNDMQETTKKLMSLTLGIYSAEYSFLSSLISPAEKQNRCNEQINKALLLCPELRQKLNQPSLLPAAPKNSNQEVIMR